MAFAETVWAGLPFQPVLLWEQDAPGGARRLVVLDGQQRLSAMGAHMIRADGSQNAPTSAFLDLETGVWQTTPAAGHPPITWMALADMAWAYKDPHWMIENWRTAMLAAEASNRRPTFFTYIIGPRTTPETVIRIFRTWNTPGTPLDPAEVERLIASAQE